MKYHVPVLLKESIEGLSIKPKRSEEHTSELQSQD